jgi:hypothetical protein
MARRGGRSRQDKSDGRLVHKTIGAVLQNRADAYLHCRMK